MKLLIDANLSWRLVKLIEKSYPGSIHVSKTGLKIPAKDKQIWDWAKMNECTIVTNDDDFFHLLQIHGFPPKVVLIRTGNQSTGFIADILVKCKEKIEAMINSKEYGLLEVY